MNTSFDIIDIAFITTCSVLILLLFITGITSFLERELRALKISFLFFVFSASGLLIPILEFPFQNYIEIVILGLALIVLIILILPINNLKKIKDYTFIRQLDERNVMFSRAELQKDEENFSNYYQQHPEKFESDEKFRANPGLLAQGSKYYNPVLFSCANSSFKTVETYSDYLKTKVKNKNTHVDAQKMSIFIKSWAKHLGAVDCGITKLKDYHKYTVSGRKKNYGQEVSLNHKYAIAFTVEMDETMLGAAPEATTVMESARQYLNAGSIAMQLSFMIKDLGNEALAHIDGNYTVICPLVAKDAGLGEIGRMGLLMTPKLGPRVRIAVVTTNLELIPDKPTFAPSVIDFCNICKKCAETCPGNAISQKNMENIDGSVRWQINQEKCFNYWTICGTDCGRCIAVCPYSHPNNLLHNIVRKGIKNSMIFRRFALKMDDVLYGRKPKPKPLPEWTNIFQNTKTL